MDLNLLPLIRQYGQDQTEWPGLYLPARPRRPARGRQDDRLLLYLVMEGNAPLTPTQYEQLLSRISQVYYRTPGSVTAALRAAAEALNHQLLERNLRDASSGQQGVGLLILLTLRAGRLYLAQCGATHVYLIGAAGVHHFYDSQPTRRGLGLGRTTPIYFSQATLSENDVLILAPLPAAEWNERALEELQGLGLESLQPRLLRMMSGDANALLIQFKPGPGKVFFLRPKSAEEALRERPQAAVAVRPAQVEAPSVGVEAAASPPPAMPVSAPSAAPASISAAVSALEEPAETAAPVAPEPGLARRKMTGRGALAAIAAALGTTAAQFSQSLRTLLRRMLPEESLVSLPGSLMAFLAVAVPLVVVSVALVVYFQRGRTSQFDQYYQQALQAAEQARAQADPLASVATWKTVIAYLDQAEAVRISPESQELRYEAYEAVDRSELVRRLDYQPALTETLPDTVQVIEVVASASDIYLLDGVTGNVWRAFATARGYELDKDFQCSPQNAAALGIGSLVDILALPPGEAMSVVGMDGQGNLLYCKAGESPVFEALNPPFTQWGSPKAMALDDNNLYVLDTEKNAVWIYWNRDKSSSPEPFFTQDFPPMQDVIDLVVEKDDLFLLHVDGHITQCRYSDIVGAPSRCVSPQPFIDSRPGREGQMILPYPAFNQLEDTQPPNPSIYLLDPANQSVYHFSLRLTYQRQLMPRQPLNPRLDGSLALASAFTFRPDNRLIFLVVDNQLYYAGMP